VRQIVAVLLASTSLAASCALRPLPPPPQRSPEPPAAGVPDADGEASEAPRVPGCAALAVRSCALPYPSDEFSVADPSTSTGRRLEVPREGLVPAAALRQLGPGAGLDSAFGGGDAGIKDGYSALSPVIFEVDQSIRSNAVPEDGGEVVKVYDTATGASVPVRVELPFDAALRGAPRTIVMAWPRLRWEHGHTYVARMAKVPGEIVTPSPAQAMGWSTPWVEALRASLAQVDDRDWTELLSATRFTVGSRANAIGGLEHMAEVAASEEHPVRNLVSHPPVLVEGTSAMISGEVAISDFRDVDGVVWPWRAPQRRWVPFLLMVPERPATDHGAPVSIYGHGLVINKESMLLVAAMNARKGVATLGIDVPNHGWRSREGGYLLELATPRRLGRLVNMPLQGIVDHVSLVGALQHHLASVDLAPWSPLGPPGDGVADLDPSVLLYEGTSMGAVLGAAEVALIPEIDAGRRGGRHHHALAALGGLLLGGAPRRSGGGRRRAHGGRHDAPRPHRQHLRARRFGGLPTTRLRAARRGRRHRADTYQRAVRAPPRPPTGRAGPQRHHRCTGRRCHPPRRPRLRRGVVDELQPHDAGLHGARLLHRRPFGALPVRLARPAAQGRARLAGMRGSRR
jgi:hypothetical protein